MKVRYNGISGELSETTVRRMKERHGIDFQPDCKWYAKPAATKESGHSHNYNKKIAEHLSRKELMWQAKEKGIKNYRILNKEELLEILDSVHQERIDQIIKEAVKRWKAGWGSRKGAKQNA